MKWATATVEYEGLPLILKKRIYDNIFNYKSDYYILLSVYFKLEKVQNNGLADPDYFLTLKEFDDHMINLFNKEKQGIIFLVETFGGYRNYFYYVKNIDTSIIYLKELENKFPNKKIEYEHEKDKNWEFIKKYPFKLY